MRDLVAERTAGPRKSVDKKNDQYAGDEFLISGDHRRSLGLRCFFGNQVRPYFCFHSLARARTTRGTKQGISLTNTPWESRHRKQWSSDHTTDHGRGNAVHDFRAGSASDHDGQQATMMTASVIAFGRTRLRLTPATDERSYKEPRLPEEIAAPNAAPLQSGRLLGRKAGSLWEVPRRPWHQKYVRWAQVPKRPSFRVEPSQRAGRNITIHRSAL